MNLKSFFTCLISGIAISAFSIFIYHNTQPKKIAFLDIKKVFNEFAMKKELEEKYTVTSKYRAKIMDSLSNNLQGISIRLKADQRNKDLAIDFDIKRNEFFKLKQQFEDDNAALSAKYDRQIIEQITQYVSDYGKKNQYNYIFGADGNGTLMYANETENISDEIIIYINKRYKGVD